MKLLHLSDLHLRSAPDALQNIRLRACIDRLLAEHADADLCLITGDLAEEPTEPTYHILRNEISRLPFRTHLLLGNHDCRDAAFTTLPQLARDPHGFAQALVVTPAGPLNRPGGGSERFIESYEDAYDRRRRRLRLTPLGSRFVNDFIAA